LAKAVAQELGWKYLVEVVHPRMEPQDLIYRFDAVKRLAYAHTKTTDDQLDSLAFYEPGVLWQALDWQSAQKAGKRQDNQEADTEKDVPCGTVVCIDEIDKADADVPNSLLEVFGERQISLPSPLPTLSWPQETQGNTPSHLPPLIILTTNEDRMLPAPFLRRCVVLTLKTESDNPIWLVEKRGQAHYTTEKSDQEARPYLSKDLMKKAADLLVLDRAGFKAAQLPLPGVAEYLDLLRALHQLQSELNWDDTQISGRLDQLSRYVYRKHAGADLAEEHQQWAKREGR
jgi:MoxR-like ATPase